MKSHEVNLLQFWISAISSTIIKDGNNFILSTGCHLPNFQVAWYKIRKDFKIISLNVSSEEHRINDADRNDAGEYFFEYLDKKDRKVFTSKLKSLIVLQKSKLKMKIFRWDEMKNFSILASICCPLFLQCVWPNSISISWW